MSGAQWDVRLQDDASAERLERSGVPYLTALTLAARGVTEPEAAHAFLARGEAGEGFHDPFLLPDMDKAIRRIQAALQNHEKIAVYGDYDVDGVTAAVLLYEQLVSMGADCVWHIPNRLSDGHGLQEDALDALKANGVSLIVTVDTGVSAVREARYAAQLGLELILTDHHECPGTLPDALAIVNPKRPGSAYPFAELAGVGVAYKLARALSGDSGEDASLRRYGDLVCGAVQRGVGWQLGAQRTPLADGAEPVRQCFVILPAGGDKLLCGDTLRGVEKHAIRVALLPVKPGDAPGVVGEIILHFEGEIAV